MSNLFCKEKGSFLNCFLNFFQGFFVRPFPPLIRSVGWLFFIKFCFNYFNLVGKSVKTHKNFLYCFWRNHYCLIHNCILASLGEKSRTKLGLGGRGGSGTGRRWL